jgi:hypothetical protein
MIHVRHQHHRRRVPWPARLPADNQVAGRVTLRAEAESGDVLSDGVADGVFVVGSRRQTEQLPGEL